MGNNFFFGLGAEAIDEQNNFYHERMQRYAEIIYNLNILSVARGSKFLDVTHLRKDKVSYHVVQSKFPVIAVFYGIILLLRLGAIRSTIYFQDGIKFCLILAFFRIFLRARCIAGVHYELRNTYNFEIKILRFFANKIRVLTLAQKSFLIRCGFDKDNIAVVSTPVALLSCLENDLEPVTPLDGLENSDASIHLIYVGRFARTKRIGELLDFLKNYAHIRLTLVAPMSSKELGFDLSEIKNKINMMNNVVWYEDGLWGDDLIRMISQSDGLISFSSEEGFGKVYVEALALGTPVITRANEGATEIASVAKGMFLFHEIDELEHFFSNLKSNLRLARSVVERNKQNIREKFNPNSNIHLFCELFS